MGIKLSYNVSKGRSGLIFQKSFDYLQGDQVMQK